MLRKMMMMIMRMMIMMTVVCILPVSARLSNASSDFKLIGFPENK